MNIFNVSTSNRGLTRLPAAVSSVSITPAPREAARVVTPHPVPSTPAPVSSMVPVAPPVSVTSAEYSSSLERTVERTLEGSASAGWRLWAGLAGGVLLLVWLQGRSAMPLPAAVVTIGGAARIGRTIYDYFTGGGTESGCQLVSPGDVSPFLAGRAAPWIVAERVDDLARAWGKPATREARDLGLRGRRRRPPTAARGRASTR